jgi:type II secretory pathway component GspD/PulD (secretin)
VGSAYQWGWIFAAAASYSVNIANASSDRVAVLARPHLTALNGTPAKFLAGGELVYKVSGNISGDIKPYPFGTTLTVTPTLLRTPAEDGTPRVHLRVEAGRTSVLALLDQDPNQPTTFTKVTVASEAVLSLGQTLILSGLSQRESRTGRSGVPGLMYIPILKYLFSTKSTIQADTAVIILLTPRDAAFRDERNQKALEEFVEKRRAFLQARQGTEENMRRFRERYPDWYQIPPNRFASHFFLMETSEIYRTVSGQDLTGEDVDLELLGPKRK